MRGVERILYERKIPVLGQKVFYNIRLDISLSKKQNSKLVVVKLMACDSFACPRNRLGWIKKKKMAARDPRTRCPKTTAKLIQNKVYYFLNITIFRLAPIPAFFRFTDVTELMQKSQYYIDGECHNKKLEMLKVEIIGQTEMICSPISSFG